MPCVGSNPTPCRLSCMSERRQGDHTTTESPLWDDERYGEALRLKRGSQEAPVEKLQLHQACCFKLLLDHYDDRYVRLIGLFGN